MNGNELQGAEMVDNQMANLLAAVRGERLDARIELGRTRLRRDEAHRLRRGSVIALDPSVAEPVDVYVADRRVARGELLTVGGKYAVRVTERCLQG
jgi:flagellar motor switch protein FliN